MAVLGAHAGHIGGVARRVGAEDRQIGVEQDGGVATRRLHFGGTVFGRLDHQPDPVDGVVGPTDCGQITPGETCARPLVGRVGGLVHGVVVERGSDDLVEMPDRFHGGEFVDVADHPRHMGGGVVAAVLLAVTGEYPIEQGEVGADMELPGDLQFEISFAHRVSVPGLVAGWTP